MQTMVEDFLGKEDHMMNLLYGKVNLKKNLSDDDEEDEEDEEWAV